MPRINGASLAPDQIPRLERALRMHAHQLKSALTDPARDIAELHLAMAGHLRALLCDAELPVLLVFAEYKRTPLWVWGPYPADFHPPEGVSVFSWSALVASSQPVWGGHQMRMEQYLDTPLGATTFSSDGGRTSQTTWYTPRQVIKWVANKDGGAHFDLETPASLQSIRSGITVHGQAEIKGPGISMSLSSNEDHIVRIALLQIADWTANAADTALAAAHPSSSDNSGMPSV
jgi:hypothetical protein